MRTDGAEARSPGLFLTAEWRSLLMLNYAVDRAVLAPYLPYGTELDFWHGDAMISMVGFRFLKTRIAGFAVPFHVNFDEVNLRFYVRRKARDGWRRGVVFVREIVPRLAIAVIARLFYNEKYSAAPMRHRVLLPTAGEGSVEYGWFSARHWNTLGAEIVGKPEPLVAGSEAEFVFEHYHGYTRQRDGGTIEYEVRHPAWRAWTARAPRLDCDVSRIYGLSFVEALSAPPCSAFVAEGSEVGVFGGSRVAG